jgi:hypothetical protein
MRSSAAEKLREPVAKAFRETFGLDLLEGYGCTRWPRRRGQRPDVRDGSEHQRASRSDPSAIPAGVVAKIVDPTTGEGRCSVRKACCC